MRGVWGGRGSTETGAENQLRFDKPTANNQQLEKTAEGATIQNFNWTSVEPANGQLTVTDDHRDHGDLCRTV